MSRTPLAHRLAQQISKRTRMTLTEVVISALEEKIQKPGRPLNREKLDALTGRMGALPILDAREPDELLGYDEFGIPR